MIPKYLAASGLKLKEPRICSCCEKKHEYMPKNAVKTGNGMFWFNCLCESTLVIKEETVELPISTIKKSELLYRIIYISRLNFKPSYRKIKALKQQVVSNNQQRNITGFLLFNKEYFIGAIEGERTVLNELFNKMTKDQRHFDIEIVSYESIEDRTFNNWGLTLLETAPAYVKIKKQHGTQKIFNPYFLSNREIYDLLYETDSYYEKLLETSTKMA